MSVFYESQQRPLVCFPLENLSFPPHFHPAVEVHFVLDGHCAVHTNDVEYVLGPEDLLMIMPNAIHDIVMDKDTETTVFCLICPLNACGEFYHLFTQSSPLDPVVRSADLPKDAIHALQMIKLQQPIDLRLARAYMQVLFSYVVPMMQFKPNSGSNSMNILESLVLYISQNLSSHLSLDVLAREIGINKYDISRLINTQLKTSLPTFVNNLRLEKAVNCLSTSSMSITDIALECGYDSLRNFNRQFKKMFHITPREYRDNHAHAPKH